ncbi:MULTISPECIES: arginine deiminase family protein [Olivibacter]|uniref:arginine deiminase n=1 Tax=Olivibacter oleidegradans TaxID=760123 RepID=A0ABV6HJN5_9SPHI|nr:MULTISPECIES: arginine deiminase family protein [Olivibacter]QEL01655.1 amidinotransferase [Olivibacter sp. LS-1]
MKPLINVNSEIGTLRKLLVHSPDSGLGQVVPSKAQDWLFEDIVHLNTLRKGEYDYYIKLLLYFLDAQKIKGKLKHIDTPEQDRAFFKPDAKAFHRSDKVIEVQSLLADILEDHNVRTNLVAAVCAIEGCNYRLQQLLSKKDPIKLAKIILSGSLDDEHMIFAPIPNLIFTRDLGIVINRFILLNKPAKKARGRESMIMRYIFFNHPIFKDFQETILEIPDPIQHFLRPGEDEEKRATLEGGDVMVVSSNHVLIGCSERTSPHGANEAIKLFFKHKVVEKVTVIKIPAKRDFMHIDTIFTQVKRNVWAVLASVAKPTPSKDEEPLDFFTEPEQQTAEIIQFYSDKTLKPRRFPSLEELLDDISRNDLNSTEKTQFIYSGNNVFPFDAREQWTDSCNLLALKEGVVLGYDRNDKTIQAFLEKGFQVKEVAKVIEELELDILHINQIENTLILLPSAELSRARGGFHCMSLPLLRDDIH